jgi:beta-lactamase class A
MLANLRDILLGDTLSSASRKQLAGWMIASKTGLSRLRAGLPAGWKAGDKTGAGAAGALNDIAILWPPAGRAPVLVCAYTDGNRAGDAAQDRALAEIGGIVAARFA